MQSRLVMSSDLVKVLEDWDGKEREGPLIGALNILQREINALSAILARLPFPSRKLSIDAKQQ